MTSRTFPGLLGLLQAEEGTKYWLVCTKLPPQIACRSVRFLTSSPSWQSLVASDLFQIFHFCPSDIQTSAYVSWPFHNWRGKSRSSLVEESESPIAVRYGKLVCQEWGTCTTSSSVLKIAQEGAARPAGWHWVAPSPAGPMTAVRVSLFVGAQERSVLPEWPKSSLFRWQQHNLVVQITSLTQTQLPSKFWRRLLGYEARSGRQFVESAGAEDLSTSAKRTRKKYLLQG